MTAKIPAAARTSAVKPNTINHVSGRLNAADVVGDHLLQAANIVSWLVRIDAAYSRRRRQMPAPEGSPDVRTTMS